MFRVLMNGMLACGAVIAVSALAYAEETVIEKHTVESQHEAVVVPPVQERRVEERTVTQQPAQVQKRTDTVVTHTRDNDDDDNDND